MGAGDRHRSADTLLVGTAGRRLARTAPTASRSARVSVAAASTRRSVTGRRCARSSRSRIERRWVYNVVGPDGASATWAFEVEPTSDGVLIRQWARMGPGPSGLTPAIAAMPDKEARIVANRLLSGSRTCRPTWTGSGRRPRADVRSRAAPPAVVGPPRRGEPRARSARRARIRDRPVALDARSRAGSLRSPRPGRRTPASRRRA